MKPLTAWAIRTAALACLAPAFCAHAAPAGDADGWSWMIAPYGWGASVGTDLERVEPPTGGASSDTQFRDIVSKFDGAFQAHVEGQGDHFGVFTDFTYLGLADERMHPRFRINSDLDTRLFELAAVWSPGPERHQGIELFAGLRYIDVDLGVAFDPENPSFDGTSLDVGKSYSDLMLGARYGWALSDRWGLSLRGDGSFGDTEGTWNASGTLEYRMNRGAWLFGYRYLSIDMAAANRETTITLHGPLVGYGFVF